MLNTVTTPTARKEHLCTQCYRTIRVGEQYRRDEGLYDDSFQTTKSCAQCHAFVEDLWDIDWRDEDPVYGGECYLYLPDADFRDIEDDPKWCARVAAYRRKWTAEDGSLIDYPRVGA